MHDTKVTDVPATRSQHGREVASGAQHYKVLILYYANKLLEILVTACRALRKHLPGVLPDGLSGLQCSLLPPRLQALQRLRMRERALTLPCFGIIAHRAPAAAPLEESACAARSTVYPYRAPAAAPPEKMHALLPLRLQALQRLRLCGCALALLCFGVIAPRAPAAAPLEESACAARSTVRLYRAPAAAPPERMHALLPLRLQALQRLRLCGCALALLCFGVIAPRAPANPHSLHTLQSLLETGH